MSRIGKQSINIPDDVKVVLEGQLVQVTGPQGALSLRLPDNLDIKQADNKLAVRPNKQSVDKQARSNWGTYQRLISNLITGVTTGFSKELVFSGVGWRLEVTGNTLVMNVGYSQPIEYKIPADIEVKVEKNNIIVAGVNKQQVGQVAAEIRAIRKVEPYKGKGIKYQAEVVRRKAGKQAKSTTGT